MVWVHRALLVTAAVLWALSTFYAVRALTGRPHRARRAARWGALAFAVIVLDTLGRVPVALRTAEEAGSAWILASTLADLTLRNAVPVLLWGTALFGRWRGWLADKVFATAILIAAATTTACYLIPLPGR